MIGSGASPGRHATSLRRRSLATLLLVVGASIAACAARDPAPTPPPNRPVRGDDLVGTEWIAQTIDGGAVATGSHSTVRFVSVAHVDGDTGCNRFMGPIAVEEGKLRIGPLATTRRACAGALMDQERLYLVALARGAALQREGDLLILLDEGQRPLVRYSQVEPQVPARP